MKDCLTNCQQRHHTRSRLITAKLLWRIVGNMQRYVWHPSKHLQQSEWNFKPHYLYAAFVKREGIRMCHKAPTRSSCRHIALHFHHDPAHSTWVSPPDELSDHFLGVDLGPTSRWPPIGETLSSFTRKRKNVKIFVYLLWKPLCIYREKRWTPGACPKQVIEAPTSWTAITKEQGD